MTEISHNIFPRWEVPQVVIHSAKLLILAGSQEAGADPSWHLVNGRVDWGQVRSWHKETNCPHSNSPLLGREWPIHYISMTLGCGRKTEYPVKTDKGTVHWANLTQKGQAAWSQTLLLWGNSPNYCTACQARTKERGLRCRMAEVMSGFIDWNCNSSAWMINQMTMKHCGGQTRHKTQRKALLKE